jgi:hypothetical protein
MNLWPLLRDFWLWEECWHVLCYLWDSKRLVFSMLLPLYMTVCNKWQNQDMFSKLPWVSCCFLGLSWIGSVSLQAATLQSVTSTPDLIGAVSVLVNASVDIDSNIVRVCHFSWAFKFQSCLPLNALQHCLINTQCKLIILDQERVNCLAGVLKNLTNGGAIAFLVMECQEGKRLGLYAQLALCCRGFRRDRSWNH